MNLSATEQKFVLHWGEMGTRWGVNRTVAQIHALLFLTQQPMAAETIAETLGVARSNVSTSIRELQSWRLVRVSHVLGDRRDHFLALQDVWEIFRIILEERKRREIDPTLSVLRECAIEGAQDAELDDEVLARMQVALDFLEMFSATFQDYQRLPPATLQRMLKMGGKVARFIGPNGKDKA
ncbi:GbsR/MarR family transcriptional regulator [Massilia sp. HP4]|uniref:GbsR/MarR family transcriptional regulator n=1 Tax=Massilia sp. HP4 TaxID=2562316 RepID=UPI0010C09EE1|nr:MarR family transcriptional regulator [Massilia sp. HP4]